jgi:hypothetical protein
MKKLKIFILLIISSLASFAQNKFPAPPTSPNRLFYIQRSNNAHTVIYDANFNNKVLNAENPVNVYWIRYDDKIHKKNLNTIEKALAYGVETKPNNGSFDIKIVAFKKKNINLKVNEKGQPMATMQINGVESQLHKIFVQIESNESFCPKVKYIEIFGKTLATGVDIYEKIKP